MAAAHRIVQEPGMGRLELFPLDTGEAPLRAMLTDLFQHLIDRGLEVRAVDTYKGWTEIDTLEDYERACAAFE